MNRLTDAQIRFLEIAEKFEALKAEMKTLEPLLQQALQEIGVGTYFQDPDTDLVYKVVVPKGKFVEFPAIGYNRTKKPEERSATLSKKEAIEKGFEL